MEHTFTVSRMKQLDMMQRKVFFRFVALFFLALVVLIFSGAFHSMASHIPTGLGAFVAGFAIGISSHIIFT